MRNAKKGLNMRTKEQYYELVLENRKLADKLKTLVGIAEMTAAKKDGTPIEYRHYVRKRDSEL